MVLNMRGRGRGHGQKFNFHMQRGAGNACQTPMITSGQPGMFVTNASFDGAQVFGGPSGYNVGSFRRPFRKFSKYNPYKNNSNNTGISNNSQEIDLTKPWVTNEILNENKKKDGFLEIWKISKSNEDWNKYKIQKLHLQTLHDKAKANYSASHPGEVQLWDNSLAARHYCETCDKSFRTEDDLLIHEGEHETCNRDGCEFTAHPKIIAKHIKMQHTSGLFKRIGNLYTEEDIVKWIEERKKRYPTRKVIEAKKVLEQEKLKRGERIKEDDSKFNKSFNKNKGGWKKNFEKRICKPMKSKRTRRKNKTTGLQKQIKDEQVEEIRKGVPAFMGIGNTKEAELPVNSEPQISDDEWENECKPSAVAKPLLNNSLGLLAECYNSDEEILRQKPENKFSGEVSADEGSGPDEVKTISSKDPFDEKSIVKVPLKRGFLKKKENHDRKKQNTFNRWDSEVKSLTLLEKLLKKEIKHERNVISQCIHYVVSHNFFKT